MSGVASPSKPDRSAGGSGGATTTPFFGRQSELDQFEAELRNPRGSAILVVGQQAMGKSILLKEFIEQAQHHPSLKCRAAWFSVTQGDSAELTMSLIMSDAEGAAEERAGFLAVTDRGRRQLKAIFELLPKGESITKLAATLKHNRKLHIREQLRSMFQLLSARLPADARAIFIIEPRKYLGEGSGEEWAIVLEDLPDRIKFIIEQRPEDAVATCDSFLALGNLVRIPQASLDVWPQDEVDACLDEFTPPSGIMMSDVRNAIASYNGHPFAIMKALELIADGEPVDNLPQHPEPRQFAQRQWERLSDTHGENAIALMQSYSILQEPVRDDLAIEVAGIDGAIFETLLARPFIAGLLPIQPQTANRSLYHTVFAEFVRERSDATSATNGFHHRTIEAYRARLNKMPPDGLAARRLAMHVRAIEENDDAFVACFVNECGQTLLQLGLFSEFETLTKQALPTVKTDSAAQGALYGNLGLVMKTRGDLNGAEVMYRKSLAIEEKLGQLEGMATQYGNLGLVMQTRGDLDEAEAMYRKALEIDEKLGRLKGMASHYGNLGNVMLIRRDLDAAEAMHRKSLEIEEKLGRLEGMASDYGNLGVVMQTRGDMDEAEAMFRKALEIDEKLGRVEGMASHYGNLGNVMRIRGDPDGAEAMYRKTLAIEDKLGHLEGMANTYGNLGILMETRGDLGGALEMWTKSRDLYAKLGAQHMVDKVQGWIDGLPG